MPQKLAGRMVEPRAWVPSATGSIRDATAAAVPLDDPPGVRRVSNGLRVRAGSPPPKHTVTVLPTRTAPPSRKRADAGRVGHRLMAFEQLAAELGRHVVGLDQVLDADRHAVDHAQRLAGLVSRAGFVGGLARPIQIEKGERHHRGIERLDAFDAALEIGARRVRAVAEFRHRIVEAQHPMRGRIVGAGAAICLFTSSIRSAST